MGLTVSGGCYDGSYPAFRQWRIELAKADGLPPLELMEGYWVSPKKGSAGTHLNLAVRCIGNKVLRSQGGKEDYDYLMDALDFDPISWDCLKPSPLHELLNHSDCDGSISWEKCAPIADCLDRVLPKMPIEWVPLTAKFIAGLRLASILKEDVEFT